LRLHTHLT